MRFGFSSIVVCSVVMTWAACQCGSTPCTTNDQCPQGQVCGPSGTCVTGSDPDGGPDGGDPDGGPDAGPDGGQQCVNLQCRQVSCPAGSPTRLTGSVYDPSGQVALYNAIVYVPNDALQPLPTGVSCDRCGALVTGHPVAIALTGPDGKFQLDNVPVGPNIPLVIQLGKWRRQVLVPFSVQACQSQAITDVGLLRLPRNQSEGDLPQMAIATGALDPFECLLLKMGISVGEMTPPSGNGRVHFYRDNGLANDAGSEDVLELYGDAGTLNRYDVTILPCIGDEKFGANPNATEQSWTRNLSRYSSTGGRLFVTHHGYQWMAFGPEPIPSTADWTPDRFLANAPPSPFDVTVNQSFPKGAAFARWLWDAGASTTLGQLTIQETRHDVSGTDGGTTTWLYGNNPTNGAGHTVQHLTFNMPYQPPPLPDGDAGTQCGRVVFSDFHVTASALVPLGDRNGVFPHDCAGGPLTPQEKALVFMLFDVTSCVQSDVEAPKACLKIGDGCARHSDCCNGLLCVDSNNNECFEGTCSCQVVIN